MDCMGEGGLCLVSVMVDVGPQVSHTLLNVENTERWEETRRPGRKSQNMKRKAKEIRDQ